MPQSPGRLNYKRLSASKQEFRLLELQPARNVEDQVICRLVTVSLADELEYVALSSLYGERSESERVVINGIPVTITAHLAQALRNMRQIFLPRITRTGQKSQQKDSRGPRWLLHLFKHVGSILPDSDQEEDIPLRIWVDVICINQNDDREKSNQNVSMAQIYRAAKMVVGWVGQKIETTEAGIDVLREIDEAMPSHWGDPGDEVLHPENYSPRHEWFTKIRHIWQDRDDGSPPFESDQWVGAVDFVNRPYFQRLWVLEEITMAKHPAFLIGDIIVSWKQILRLNRFLEELKDRPSNVYPDHLRSRVHDWPLGTIHVLLDEFAKQRRAERALASDVSTSASDGASSRKGK